jgi:AraC-like DNA-binding protein
LAVSRAFGLRKVEAKWYAGDRMPGSGTRSFVDPDDYQAGLRQLRIGLSITCRGAFQGRVTWVELDRLYLLRCQEEQSRVAFLSLPRDLIFVGFRAKPGPPPLWGGMALRSGDIMVHSRGERIHQRTMGPCHWNLIALTVEDLEEFSQTLFGQSLVAPAAGRILRPSPCHSGCLQRLHAAACRLAERRPQALALREAARSLEQDLILALAACLAATVTRDSSAARRHHAKTMIRFEDVLAEHLSAPLSLPALCARVGVSERMLRSCCAEFLGISPTRYVRLRRLEAVRIALRDADPITASVADIVHDHGFTERRGRFAAAYLAAFGETPSTTLQRTHRSRFLGRMPPNSAS